MILSLKTRISAFSKLGEAFKMIAEVLENESFTENDLHANVYLIQRQSTQMNPWFTKENICFAFKAWSKLLTTHELINWTNVYGIPDLSIENVKKVAVINAGNIPLVGFHDFLSVLISGNKYIAKNSSDDKLLLPYIASLLIDIEPGFKSYITFTERLSDFNAVIATGSNNSARYFNSYFGKYPHIIRKNRNAVAVLDGSEDKEFFINLSEDIFRYFGLGCRNVSKLYVPAGYNFNLFFESIFDRSEVMQHNKYMNNFEHHNAVLLLKQIPFLQNGFLIVMENESLSSPVAVLNFEYYSEISLLINSLDERKDEIQCIVSNVTGILHNAKLKGITVDAGKSQEPGLSDYADRVDTMSFLLKQKPS